MINGRECFDPNMMPLNEFNKKLSWPPTYIQCDCNKIIGRSQKNNGNFYWKCPECKKEYSMVMGNIVLQ